MVIEPGQHLLHYRLIEKIGKGGMGVVWKAEDTKLHRDVALKVLPNEVASDPERRKRFEREAQTVASLNHPNIVTVHSVEEADGTHFITMERVEGDTLSGLVPKDGLRLARFFELAAAMADAVAAAHQRGITHRDLKPDNIMVTAEGRLKILDFGLAKLREEAHGLRPDSQLATATATEPGRVLGTVAYMSPEQAQGKPVDHRADIFSLGVVLYEMATGRRPFTGDTSVSVLSSVLRDTPPSVTDVKPGLPRHLGRIVRRCLHKDPERRYHSAKDLRNDLEELKGEIDSGQLELSASAPSRRSRLRLILVAGVGTIALAVVAYSVFFFMSRGDRPAEALKIKPLTGAQGFHGHPTWSPDGSFMAFVRNESGYMRIFVQATGGGEPVLLTRQPGDHSAPRWSPDGRQIAFVSARKGHVGIYLIPPLEGQERLLVQTLGNTEMGRLLAATPWSPDSRELLFTRPDGIGKINVATGEESHLTGTGGPEILDQNAAWSFDGKTVVFERHVTEEAGLWLIPATGGEPRLLLDDGVQPAWTPDDRRVVFSSSRTGSENLWEIEIESGRLRQLTVGAGNDSDAVVARNGRLAFHQWSEEADLWVSQVEDGSARRLTSHTSGSYNPRYSPDGKHIAYQSGRTGNWAIWQLDLDSGAERQLTFHEAWEGGAEWSPDGKRIAFISQRDGADRLWVLDLSVGSPRRLTAEVLLQTRPKWSPDGSLIAYHVLRDGRQVIRAVEPDGANAHDVIADISEAGVDEGEFGWYRDNQHIIYSRSPLEPNDLSGLEMVVRNLDTGREAVLYRGPHAETIFAPDGRAVAFCADSHFRQDIYVLRLEPPNAPDGLPTPVGEPVRITDAQGQWHVHLGGWSPDSKEIAYAHCAPQGDILVIENYR